MDRKSNVISVPMFSRDTEGIIDEVVRKRLFNVLDYISEVEKIGAKVPVRISDHKRPAFYEHKLKQLPGIRFDLTQDNQIWMEIKRLQPVNPPFPENKILRMFVKIPNDPVKIPIFDSDALQSAIDNNAIEATHEIKLDEFKIAWQAFLEGPYTKWREEEIPRRQTIHIYADLFGLNRAMEVDSASDPIELVWGIGLALWKVHGKIIEYPLLVQGVEVQIDDRTMNLHVCPRESEVLIELSPFSALNNAGASAARKSMSDFLEDLDRSLSPFDSESFSGALRAGISVLDSSAYFWEKDKHDPDNCKPPVASERLVVTDTWALFVRPKTSHFLLQDLERLKEAVKKLEKLPAGPFALFKDPSKDPISFSRIPFRGISSPNPDPIAGRNSEDLFFPRPYNREQMQIAERLEQAPGVVAQGPPGTGKTHTIANIICHNLAKGRSILVTSKGEQALRVLKEKLPEAIQPLTVSLLASDREALKEMEQAVDSILQRLQSIDKESVQYDIEADRKRVDFLCATVARTQNEIRDWARKQLKEVKYLGRSLMPDDLAQVLVREREIHSWLPGPVTWSEEPFSITDDDIENLRRLRRKLGVNLEKHMWSLPALDEVPTVDEYADLHQALIRKKRLIEGANVDGLPTPKRDYSEESLGRARQLLKALRLIQEVVDLKSSEAQRWLDGLFQLAKKKIESPESSGIKDQIETIIKEVFDLETKRNELIGHPVTLPDEASDDNDFVAAVNRLAKGLSAFNAIGRMTKGRQKKWLKEVRLLGAEPAGEEGWQWVSRHLDHIKEFEVLRNRWNAFMREIGGPIFEGTDFESGKMMANEALKGQKAFFCCEKGLPFARKALPMVFMGNDGFPSDIEDPEIVRKYINALENHTEQGLLIAAEIRVKDLDHKIVKHKNDLCQRFRIELHHNLGNSNNDENQLLQKWDDLRDELAFLLKLQPLFSQAREIATKIEKAGAFAWAEALLLKPAGSQTDSLLPANWSEGIEWHRFMNYLEGIDGQERLQELADQLRKAEKTFSQTQERLVENLTWLRMTKISEEYQRALRQYSIAISRIGAGKGKVRTPRYRREAREAMKKAVGAVPCWIMPHWRISETLPADIGRFDLVIVDEASQSDIWALPALLRGKKLLVVGDDKQVSPSVIGKSEAALTNLSQQYLKGFDLGKQMGPESSIYDLAQVAFASDNICLREHFRCAEPIITFSDRQWYRCLVPLRVPKPSERIDPPLVDVFVKDGNRDDRKKINIPEAQAIVSEIKILTQDPAFKSRSIGVISLLGQGAQSKLIAKLLFDAIGEEKIREHDIVCGDPSSFQGNEKDIIFLSMVDDPTQLRSRSDKSSAQRFNVAASRARDRMYLFRSFQRDDIHNPNDLRGALVDHFTNPLKQDQNQLESLRDLCESDFEERVFDALSTQGYRVTPQVPAGGFRIDLVVEGPENRRLAIECDGARYHGPDRYFEDLSRQRVLERAGWTFWRCWGSAFYRDPDKVLDNLYETLREMGITPLGPSDNKPSSYVEYREVCGLENFEDSELGFETVDFAESEESDDSTEDVIDEEPEIDPHDTEKGENSAPQKTRVQLNDTVTYCFIDNEDEIKTIQIVKGHSQPSMGIIDRNAPLGAALLGCCVGEEVDIHLPTGVKIASVISVNRAK